MNEENCFENETMSREIVFSGPVHREGKHRAEVWFITSILQELTIYLEKNKKEQHYYWKKKNQSFTNVEFFGTFEKIEKDSAIL